MHDSGNALDDGEWVWPSSFVEDEDVDAELDAAREHLGESTPRARLIAWEMRYRAAAREEWAKLFKRRDTAIRRARKSVGAAVRAYGVALKEALAGLSEADPVREYLERSFGNLRDEVENVPEEYLRDDS